MVKKVLIVLFFILLLFPFTTVYAYSTEGECVTAVNNAADREYLLLRDLNTYFDTYKDDLLDIASYDALYETDAFDFPSLVDRAITLLNEKGHTAAANELTSLKPRLVGDYNYIKDEYYAVKQYVANNPDKEFPTIDDILYAIKSSIPRFKDEAKQFYNNYFEMYKEDIKNKFENENLKASDLETLIDKLFTNSFGVAKYRSEALELQGYYNDYHMEDYENLIDDYIEEYRTTFNNKYNELLNYLKTYTKKEVQKRINVYKQDLDQTDPDSVDAYNAKVLALVDRTDYYLNYYDYKKGSINEYVILDKYKNKLLEKEAYIEECFEKLKDYIRTFLIDVDYIEVRDPDADGDLIKIDNVNHLIIYYEHEDLSMDTFIGKLKARVGTIESSVDYQGRVGTKSKIVNVISATQSITYDVIVKGDVHPDGKVSAFDYIAIRNHIMESTLITDDYLRIAADIYEDNKISAFDYIQIRKIIMEREY